MEGLSWCVTTNFKMAKVTLLISRRTRINITSFNEKIYIHLNQINGVKSFTLNSDELIMLFKKCDIILKAIKKLKQKLKPKPKEI